MAVDSSVQVNKRIASIDAIRIVALIAIVIGHVYPHSELDDRLVQSWRLPIFFVLSGYFWSRRRDMQQEVSRRWKQLLVPYLWWLAILALVTLPIMALKDPDSLEKAITGVLLGGSYATRPLTTFWFFTALFVATVLYRYLSTLPTWVRLSAVAVGLGVNLVFGSALAAVPYSIASALGALVFLEVGRAVRMARDTRTSMELAWAAVVCLALAIVTLVLVEDFVPIDMKKGQFPALGIAVAVLIGAALVLAATSAPPLGERFARWLNLIAAPSLSVILLHPMVLWVLRPESGRLPLWLVALAAFFLPLIFGLIVARTRLAPALLGIPRRVS